MAGTFTEITLIDAPSSAVAGEQVAVSIIIKNLYTDTIHVSCVGVLDSVDRFIDWKDFWIPAGYTHLFAGSFTMPDRDVTIHGYSYYEGVDGNWHSDDEASKDVSLGEVIKGTITKKELEYDSTRSPIPVY